ncbi:MAG: ribonuclease III [Desulfobacterales bacterium]|jgi:ribonuclease III
MKSSATLEARMGYRFNAPQLLAEALRHSSFVNEQPDSELADNERLEFLGDAVVNLVAGQILMVRHPALPEGELSRMRAALVNEACLAEIARNLKLGDHLQLGRGEELTQGREKDSILSDAYEALVAAIYLDGGFEIAFAQVERQMNPFVAALEGSEADYDYKTRLQERIQSRYKVTPLYELIGESGPDHDKRFTIQMKTPNLVTTGVGRSKKAAEQDAARKAFEKLEG